MTYHRLGQLRPDMSQPTDSNDPDRSTGRDIRLLDAAVDADSGTHQRRRDSEVDFLGEFDDEASVTVSRYRTVSQWNSSTANAPLYKVDNLRDHVFGPGAVGGYPLHEGIVAVDWTVVSAVGAFSYPPYQDTFPQI